MILYDLTFASWLAWWDEPWWFSVTPSRKEKLRGETSLANMKVMLRVVSVQKASTIMSSMRRTNSGGLTRWPPDVGVPSPPLSRLVNSMAERARLGGGVRRSGRVG